LLDGEVCSLVFVLQTFLHLKILQIMRDNSFRHKFEMLFYVGKVPWLLNLFAQLKFSVRAPYF